MWNWTALPVALRSSSIPKLISLWQALRRRIAGTSTILRWAMSHLETIKWMTGLTTSSVFQFTTTFSPKRWIRYVRAAWSPLWPPVIQWIPKRQKRGAISPSVLNCWVQFVCPTMHSEQTPGRMWFQTFSFCKNGSSPSSPSRIGCTSVRTRTALRLTNISLTIRRWSWGTRPLRVRNTASRILPWNPLKELNWQISFTTQWNPFVAPMPKRNCRIWRKAKQFPARCLLTRMWKTTRLR